MTKSRRIRAAIKVAMERGLLPADPAPARRRRPNPVVHGLAAHFGVSRQTIYNTINRVRAERRMSA